MNEIIEIENYRVYPYDFKIVHVKERGLKVVIDDSCHEPFNYDMDKVSYKKAYLTATNNYFHNQSDGRVLILKFLQHVTNI